MIVPMKKIHLIVQKKEMESALEDVRKLGVLHVEHQEEVKTPEISNLKSEISMLSNMINYLRERMKSEQKESKNNWIIEKDFRKKDFDALGKAGEVVSLLSKIEQIKEEMSFRRAEILNWEPWGNFNPADLALLEKNGYFVYLGEGRVKGEYVVPAEVVLEEVSNEKGKRRFFAISKDQVDLPFTVIRPPAMSLEKMKAAQKHDQAEIDHIESELAEYIQYVELFEDALEAHKDTLCFEETVKGMKDFDKLVSLRGYSPIDLSLKVKEKAKIKQWAVLIEDPAEEDKVPTLLKNPRWVNLIKPVFDIINVLPGYKEFDVSLIFLVFFSLFVGMLVGDAGYGLLVLILFGGVHWKTACSKKEVPVTNFLLVYLLCGCSILWGALTGTFFGQQWLPASFKPIVPWLLDDKNLQILCFLIGTIHLSIAHIWNMVMKFPNLKALGDLGWMLIIWGMYAVAKFLVLDVPMPQISLIFLSVGAGLVVVFTSPNKNLLKAMGPGVGAILLNGINSFTDVVSYIRLYAVGLATVAVADAANEMSIGWIIILHTVNLILAGLAILVHGIRLNILEFSSNHLSLGWTGFKYSPFKRVQKTIE